MRSKSGVLFSDRLVGRRVVRGTVCVVEGRRIRFHAINKWNTLYWSCDLGEHFAATRGEALRLASAIDYVEG